MILFSRKEKRFPRLRIPTKVLLGLICIPFLIFPFPLLSNEEGSGLLDQILTEAFSRIGKKVEFVYIDTAHSLVDVIAGLFDAEINRIAGMEMLYPQPKANAGIKYDHGVCGVFETALYDKGLREHLAP